MKAEIILSKGETISNDAMLGIVNVILHHNLPHKTKTEHDNSPNWIEEDSVYYEGDATYTIKITKIKSALVHSFE